MDFFNIVEKRHSVKQFKKESISPDKIDKILEAARLAPSWSNEQCWKFIVVDESKQKQKLSESIPKNNSARESIEQAPISIVLCANPKLSGECDGKEYYMLDSGIAMEHLILAAVNEGIGTCWIGELNEDKVREILDIPRSYRVIAMTPLGYPKEHDEEINKKEISEIAYKNQWESPIHNHGSSN